MACTHLRMENNVLCSATERFALGAMRSKTTSTRTVDLFNWQSDMFTETSRLVTTP